MTPEEQGIHKMGQNGTAFYQKCSYNMTLLPIVSSAPAMQQLAWWQPAPFCRFWSAQGSPTPCKEEMVWKCCCPREECSFMAIALDCSSRVKPLPKLWLWDSRYLAEARGPQTCWLFRFILVRSTFWKAEKLTVHCKQDAEHWESNPILANVK